MCGLALALRIQLFPAVAVAGLHFCRSRWRARIPVVLPGILLPVTVFGIVDAVTWSYPFQSFFRYFWVNAVEGRSELYGTEPWYWYLLVLLAHLGPILLLALLGVRRSPFLGWIALAILAPHSLLAHKEVRFIYPLVPILITLAALGTMELAKELDQFFKSPMYTKATVSIALALFALLSAFLAPQFNWWVRNSGTMAIVDQLSRDPAVCGLGIHGTSWLNTGGYTHLHRNIPMILMSDGTWSDQEQEASSVNAVITLGSHCTRGVALVRVLSSMKSMQNFGKQEIERWLDYRSLRLSSPPCMKRAAFGKCWSGSNGAPIGWRFPMS
jgi:hypothetical protein